MVERAAAAERDVIPDHVDVLVVGAGLAGIGVGYHLKMSQPDRSFVIIEGRSEIGGTWNLFRYPGVRSDSDLHTYGFGFKAWESENAIADAHEILDYLHEAVGENDLARHIHVAHKVVGADFSTSDSRWTVTIERVADGSVFEVTAQMLYSAAGYYDVNEGYTPAFVGREDFSGQIVHPQHWPEELDYSGKKVVVIGSGATAVTLIPGMAESADHVTMLQRSPTFILPQPRKDPIANTLRRLLPDMMAYRLTRRINTLKTTMVYRGSRRFPKQARALLRKINVGVLPEGFDVDTHFNPVYNPLEQRLCLVPDGDLFAAISSGSASVVTDRIDCFTRTGILLESGVELEADIIVTATGLNMVPFGKIPLSIDGHDVHLPDHVVYKSLMVSGVPNFVFMVGYVNNSWTLKVDLVAQWFCRLLGHMSQHGYAAATPVVHDPAMSLRPYIDDMSSGYFARAMHLFPKQGTKGPWRVEQNYSFDRRVLLKEPIDDASLHFVVADPHGVSTLPLQASL